LQVNVYDLREKKDKNTEEEHHFCAVWLEGTLEGKSYFSGWEQEQFSSYFFVMIYKVMNICWKLYFFELWSVAIKSLCFFLDI